MKLLESVKLNLILIFVIFEGIYRSPGEGNGNPLQYSCLENSMYGEAWVGYSTWGPKESDMTEWHHFHFHYRQILIDLIRLKVKEDKFVLEMLIEGWVLILFRSSF